MIFGAVSDDFTGGLELASLLVRDGVACPLVTSDAALAEAGDVPAVVYAVKSRVAPVGEATAAVETAMRALQAKGAGRLFLKYCATFDSTPAGNIGPCADVLAAGTQAPFVGFCPSFPEVRRTVHQGHLFVGDRLVSESPKRHDPLTPMDDPDLVRVLQRQTAAKVGLVAHDAVAGGRAGIGARVAELAGQGVRYAIMDAADEGDLANVAAATVDWKLMTGNSSVAAHYPPLWRAAGLLAGAPAPRPLPAVGGSGAVLAGSCAEQTLAQLARFGERHPVLFLDMQRAIDGADLAAEALEWAAARLAAGPAAIATSAGTEAVAAVQQRIGRDPAARLAERVLGDIARGLRAGGVRRLVVAGGETSGAVVHALGCTRLHVGRYEAPGISRAVGVDADPMALCLKSGKLGPFDMFARVLDDMRHGDAA